MTPVQDALAGILHNYAPARLETFSGTHPIRRSAEALCAALRECPPVFARTSLHVKYSVGKGAWARVPWVALLDSRETSTLRNGVYCIYLFRQDMTGAYLTLNQGVWRPGMSLGADTASVLLKRRAASIRQEIRSAVIGMGFALDESIDLRVDAGLARRYAASTICHKFYEANDLPDDRELVKDLGSLLEAYDRYLAHPTLQSLSPGRTRRISGGPYDRPPEAASEHPRFPA